MDARREMEEKNFRVIQVLKTIGSPVRFQICRLLLKNDEMSVSELTDEIGTSQNQTSQHLKKCRDTDIVRYRHEGKQVIYRLKKPDLVEEIINLARRLSRDEDD